MSSGSIYNLGYNENTSVIQILHIIFIFRMDLIQIKINTHNLEAKLIVNTKVKTIKAIQKLISLQI